MQMAKRVVGNVDQRIRKVSISWKGRDEKASSTTVEAKAGMGKGMRPAISNTPTNLYTRPNKYKHHLRAEAVSSESRCRMAHFPRGFPCLMFQGGDVFSFLLLKQHGYDEYSIGEDVFQGGDVTLPNLSL